MGRRVVEEALDEHVHARVERGGEQHPLATARSLLEDAAHGREEAEVGHVVGLVEHGHLDGAEVDVALLDQVLETTRAGDDDVDALADCLYLGVLAHAAEDGSGLEPVDGRERRQCGVDLGHELTGRGEDQGAGALRRTTAAGRVQPGDERQQECERLAGAGAAAAEDVATTERVRQRRGLDGGGFGDAGSGQHVGELSGYAELGK